MPQHADDPAGVPAGVAAEANGLPATAGDAPPETPPVALLPPPAAVVERVTLRWGLVFGIVIVDQITKALVRATIPLYDSVGVIPGLLDITHVRNPGVAFGLLSDLDFAGREVVTTALALLALAGIIYYARHLRPDERLARLGLSVILGGAVGNLIDRFRVGYVIDFVDVNWQGWHFWAFNVADASITIGALLVFIELLTHRHHVSHPV